MNGQELELFRIGDYGPKGKYTAADMDDLVARYSATGESPVTIGHPENDDEPAYAWVKGLRFSGDTLFGTVGDVTPELDSLVQAKKYKHRSVSLSRSQDGKLQLRHVAYLGAVQPHVKGLKPASFSSDPYEVFAFSEGDNMADEKELKKSIGEGIAAFFSEKFGSKPAVEPVDQAKLVTDITAAIEAKFSDQLKAEKDARAKLEGDLATHKQIFSAADANARVEAVIGQLKTAGAWVPAYERPEVGVRALFSELAKRDEIITFSDKDNKEVKRDLVTVFSDVLKSVGAIVPKTQIFSAAKENTPAATVPSGNGAEIEASSITFSEMVSARSAEKGIPYTEAYRQLTAEGKRPKAGAAAAGAA